LTSSEVGGVSESVSVQVTTISITILAVTLRTAGVGGFITNSETSRGCTCVCGVSSVNVVCFPNIEFRTTSMEFSVNVSIGANKFDVSWTLSITVTSTVFGSSSVYRRDTTISSKGTEVQGTVKTTANLRNVNIKGEFLVLEFENLVLGVSSVHEVNTGSNVASSDVTKAELVSRGSDRVRARVVDTLKSTSFNTSGRVWAKR